MLLKMMSQVSTALIMTDSMEVFGACSGAVWVEWYAQAEYSGQMRE